MKGEKKMAKKDTKEYEVSIRKTGKDMDVKERIGAKRLDDSMTLEKDMCIDLVNYAVLDIHNEKTKDGTKDYTVLALFDKNGSRYHTSSESFMTSLFDILDEFEEAGMQIGSFEDGIAIKVCEKQSKNFAGNFYTCTVL